jgi:cytochrome b subunit of formate dehydrogenase
MRMSFPSFTVLGAALLTGIIGMEWAVSSFTLLLVAVSLSLIIFVPRLHRLDSHLRHHRLVISIS